MMKRIKLTLNENNEAKEIVNHYRRIENELTIVQNQLQELDEQKEKLILALNTTREQEIAYFDKLTEKYGEGKLDLLSFEYVKNNDKK